jgi:hypothetical protein
MPGSCPLLFPSRSIDINGSIRIKIQLSPEPRGSVAEAIGCCCVVRAEATNVTEGAIGFLSFAALVTPDRSIDSCAHPFFLLFPIASLQHPSSSQSTLERENRLSLQIRCELSHPIEPRASARARHHRSACLYINKLAVSSQSTHQPFHLTRIPHPPPPYSPPPPYHKPIH